MRIKVIGILKGESITLCLSYSNLLFEVLVQGRELTFTRVEDFSKSFDYVPIIEETYYEVPFDLVPLSNLKVKDSLVYESYFTCSIDLKHFKPITNKVSQKLVWVFYGNSSGKEILASYLGKDYQLFETDKVEELPSIIDADIILVGNRNKTLRLCDIYCCLPSEVRVIEVNFDEPEAKIY